MDITTIGDKVNLYRHTSDDGINDIIRLPSLAYYIKQPEERREFICPDTEVKVRDGSYCMLEIDMLLGEEKFAAVRTKEGSNEYDYLMKDYNTFCSVYHIRSDLLVSKANIYTNGAELEEVRDYLRDSYVRPYVWQKVIVHPTRVLNDSDDEIIKELLVMGYLLKEPLPKSEYHSLRLSQTARKMLEQ